MSQVKLEIGSRTYAVACPDGQEAHIAKLGEMIAQKYNALGRAKAPQEAQNLLFAALFLADELHELKAAPPQSEVAESGKVEAEAKEDDKGKVGKKAELRAEIEELKKSEKKLTKQRDSLIKELADLRSGGSEEQVDMFGEDVLAARLEKLAARAEACADAYEGNPAAN
jgi:cell division protein ZapA